MADIVTVQELENAKIDARTIGESVNENKIVTPRYGAPFKSLPMIAEEMMQTGASKQYATLALANADIANIALNKNVFVSESANGGYWYKATAGATSLTKSPYDPLTQAKDFTNSRLEFKKKLYGYAELYKAIKQNETYVDSGTGQYGGFTFKDLEGSEATATFYIDVTITTKGDANALVLSSGLTSVKTFDASQGFAQGAQIKFAWQATKLTSGDVGLFAQVRTRYPTSQTMNATIRVNYFGAFKGLATQAEIEKYLSGDETTVQKAAFATQAETSNIAIVANTFVDYPLDVKKKLFGHAELIKNIYTGSAYVDSGIGNLGGSAYYENSADVTATMCYIDVTITNVGSATALDLMSGITSIKTFTAADGFVNGGRIKYAWQANRITGGSNNNLLMQVRTKYVSASSVRDASLFFNTLAYYKGGVTKAQIEKTIANDTTTVLLADSVANMPVDYLNTVVFDADRTKSLATVDQVKMYSSVTAAAAPNAYAKLEDGKFKIGATVDTSVENPRFWYGFEMPTALLTSATKWYLVLRGKFTSNGVSELKMVTGGGEPDVIMTNSIIAENIIDGQERTFETIIPVSYTAGYTGNGRYIFVIPTGRTSGGIYSLAMEFDSFGIVKSTDLSNQMGMAEFRTLQSKGKYSYIKRDKLDPQIATNASVDSKIAAQKVSKLTANDFKTICDIEMILTYGQSVAVGGMASDSNTDFANTLTFLGGTNVWNIAFTTQAEKDAYFGTDFVKLNGKVTVYTPAAASVRAMIQLAKEENAVSVTDFNYAYVPQTGGLTGEEIIKMNKGTKPYTDILEVITKAKAFANKKGLTFRVAVLNWVQGESDKDRAAGYYYPLLEQLFTDFNTDIKAITAQVEDVNIITYQTSPVKGLYTPSGSTTWQTGDYDNPVAAMHVSNAQVAIANAKPNVYCCGAMYQYEYSDIYHPKDRAVVGLQQGIAAKRIIHDGKPWVTFQPISHEVIQDSGVYFVRLKFDAPCKPIRFDVSGDKYHNLRGKQPNFGFKILNSSGVDIIASEPSIVKGDTVVFKCIENPVGATVQYATNGHHGGGNLCDSQNITIINKAQTYTIDNFCIAFDNYVI